MILKIGDKVRVKPFKWFEKNCKAYLYCFCFRNKPLSFVTKMSKYCESTFTIEHIGYSNSYGHEILLKNTDYIYQNWMLIPLNSKPLDFRQIEWREI